MISVLVFCFISILGPLIYDCKPSATTFASTKVVLKDDIEIEVVIRDLVRIAEQFKLSDVEEIRKVAGGKLVWENWFVPNAGHLEYYGLSARLPTSEETRLGYSISYVYYDPSVRERSAQNASAIVSLGRKLSPAACLPFERLRLELAARYREWRVPFVEAEFILATFRERRAYVSFSKSQSAADCVGSIGFSDIILR